MPHPRSLDRLRQLGYPVAADGSMPLPPLPRAPLGRGALADQFELVDGLTARQRVTAMYRGELSYVQLSRWAATHPDEVALVNDEFVFITAGLPDVAESTQSVPAFELTLAA